MRCRRGNQVQQAAGSELRSCQYKTGERVQLLPHPPHTNKARPADLRERGERIIKQISLICNTGDAAASRSVR